MALSGQEIGAIALKLLQEKIQKKGIYLRPKRVKRDVDKFAERIGISTSMAAEFVMIHAQIVFDKTMAELGGIIADANKPKGE